MSIKSTVLLSHQSLLFLDFQMFPKASLYHVGSLGNFRVIEVNVHLLFSRCRRLRFLVRRKSASGVSSRGREKVRIIWPPIEKMISFEEFFCFVIVSSNVMDVWNILSLIIILTSFLDFNQTGIKNQHFYGWPKVSPS